MTWGQKVGHGVRLKENLVNTLAVIFSTGFSSNLVRMFVSVNARFLLRLGHVGSQGQIKGKPCEHSIGHIFDLILIKLGQNVCLNEY